MSDLLVEVGTSLAFDAAKYAIGRYAYPVLRRVFRARFVETDGPDVATAKERTEAFFQDLDARIAALECDQRISDERLDELFQRPEVTGAMYDACETAMETSDLLKRKTLADLVIERLRAKDESVWAPASRIAIERMRDVTPQQARVLGLITFLTVRPLSGDLPSCAPAEQYEAYREWLLRYAPPELAIPLDGQDFAHLQSLGLIEYDLSRGYLEGNYIPTLLEPMHVGYSELREDPDIAPFIPKIRALHHADQRNGIPAVAACMLTPAGELIAVKVLREDIGLEVEL